MDRENPHSELDMGLTQRLYQFLTTNQITYIPADEPQYGNLATIPFVPQLTTDIAYFRFHGRNRENWLKKGVETSLRYAYLYSDNELKEFTPSIRLRNRWSPPVPCYDNQYVYECAFCTLAPAHSFRNV
jgi:uncharacterized protein YecE (DUF72 family)